MKFCGSFFTLAGPTLVLLATFTAGCRSLVIDNQANVERFSVRMEALRRIAYSTCADGKPTGVNCGLITKRVSDPEYRSAFREKYCSDQTDDACQELFQRQIDAELAQRYSEADTKAITATCDLHPRECEDPYVYERYLLASHNTAIRAKLAKDENAIEDERERRQDEHIREGFQGSMAVLSAAAQTADEIQFQRHGGSRCRTYPNIHYGSTTYCQNR